MSKKIRLRPILASVLVLALAREAVCDDLVTTYGSLFNDHVDLTVPGYTGGSDVVTNFPLLVRFSESSLAGFSYARVDAKGEDLRFLYYDPWNATSESVPCEVDTWNTNGESSVWVRLPKLSDRSGLKLTMYWAPNDPEELPANAPRAVWSGYASVWHLNGSVADSSPYAIESTPGAKASAQAGVIGTAFGARVSGANGPTLLAPSGTALDGIVGGAYAVSGWVRINNLSGGNSSWFYSTRATSVDNAYGAAFESGTSGVSLKLYRDSSASCEAVSVPSGEWVHLAVVHWGPDGRSSIYVNGSEYVRAAGTDVCGTHGFALGGLAGLADTLNGDLDEVRVHCGALTNAWFENEYAQAVSSSYVAFGTVSSTGRPVYVDDSDIPETTDPTPGAASSCSPDDFAGTAVFVPAETAAGAVLTNFVTLVRVWKDAPKGFKPAELPFGTEDIRFFDQDGTLLPFDLDTWDANGESAFWVLLPTFSAKTKITMCWGFRAGRQFPSNDPTSVWSAAGYRGVWHLSDAADATANAATGAFGANAVLGKLGAVGKAAGTVQSGRAGAILDIESNAAIDSLTNGSFTVSGWVYLNRTDVRHGALFSRGTETDPAWGARFGGGTAGDSSALTVEAGSSDFTAAAPVAAGKWTHFEFVYSPKSLAVYLDGEKKGESVASRAIRNGSSGRLAIGSLVSTAADVLGTNTLNGCIDEFRLRSGAPTEAELSAEYAQCANDAFYTRQPAAWDGSAVLQNRWKTLPTAGRTEWNEGEEPCAFTNGVAWYGEAALSYRNRSTAEELAAMPTEPGDYSAVFTVPEDESVPCAELTYSIDFRIRMRRPTHDLGQENDRILLLNGDTSVSDGKVYAQAYNSTATDQGRPFWTHDIDTGTDYTLVSPYYNFCGGLRHTYFARDGETRLWDLLDVRYGNTYNNADAVYEYEGDYEEWDEGLEPDQNYLPWNPAGGCLVEDGYTAEGWHEYAAQAVLCNTTVASVNSGLYTNGIGTIYFDCVNSHTDDATNGFYRLVVEVATNAVTQEENEADRRPNGLPTDEAIAATHEEWSDEAGAYVTVVHDPYKFAGWQKLEMRVKLVNGATMTDLEPTDELDLSLAGGGSYTNFYRVYVPVDCHGAARFRIRRTAVNPAYTTVTDFHSMILVDNVICSAPTDRVRVEPRGFYDASKVKRETVGYEGAFLPSYPSVHDATLYARARAHTLSGAAITAGRISSVRMNYRWRYLNQQATEWLASDLDPTTLVSVKPLAWPLVSGDLEYWYEVNQSNAFYQYADYSGAGLGLPGYSEEIASADCRAPTYDPSTQRGDWFTRVRDGTSTYGSIRLYVRRGSATAADETPVDLFVTRDRVWRGCLLATNAVAGGIYFRLEGRDRQDDTLADFQFNTNYWHYADTAESLPVTGSVVAGKPDDWGRVPCDGATGYLLFQLDEQTLALTVVHADWQDFNGWNDAHRPYFSGTSTEDSSKAGVSSGQREYACAANRWEDDIATNAFWIERFRLNSYAGYDFYVPFESARTPNGFDVGEGMWVRGAYAVESDVAGMALQMAGQGRGYFQLTDPTVWPRGIASVRFSARIAQTVSPDDFAYSGAGLMLDDYTFLTRAAFDQNANSNFTGNASLSLAAFYWPRTGCYEARWEQIAGEVEDNSGTVLGPSPRGQRLALYRWTYNGEWTATELFAATNSGSVYSWPAALAPQAIPQTHSITNGGLMPFMIGAYGGTKETLIVAAVHIKGGNRKDENAEGNTALASAQYLAEESGWLYLVYRDASDERLTRGTYGVLAANCEGVFVRPQFHDGIVSWEGEAATKKLQTQVYPTKVAATAALYSTVEECAFDIVRNNWIVPAGRMERLSATSTDCYNGFRASVVTQTVDLYTAPLGTSSWSTEPVASRTLVGFGKPGVAQNASLDFWSAEDSSVRIRTGGTVRKNIRTDVVIDNIEISQWRGQDWLGNNATERSQGGPTNFVYTSGWISDGALQLSPRRTPDGEPCSLRVPLCDGGGSGSAKRGLGLGSLSVKYRNAQTNASLLVQIATNGVNELNLLEYTKDPGKGEYSWTTVTNWDFSAMTDDERAGGELAVSPGLHGVAGTMRVIVNPALRDRVKDLDDPTAFGSVEIVSALFRDEPALDKGCWWGFNVRTFGGASDRNDSERRMYLPDNPLRSSDPQLSEYGQSIALNNSVTDGCDPYETSKIVNPYRAHMPFLQSPTFASNLVGEVSFRARKYTLGKGSQHAEVALYGTTALDIDKLDDKDWTLLDIFLVTNTTYETYRYKTDGNESYRVFRFAVRGVSGVNWSGGTPVCGSEPVRVLLDEVLVSEAVRARLAFRNTGAFRHEITNTTYVANVPSESEQPICGEGWGIQTEIYPAMLGDEIDRTVTPRVRLHYYKGISPWGYSQWKSKGTSAWLSLATDTNDVYRSSVVDSPDAVIPLSSSTEVVQWMLEVVYSVVNPETGARSFATNYLESADWSVPSWYRPVDYNATRGDGRSDQFAAYTIIEPIAPGWAWINEINLFGEFTGSFRNSDRNRQFVEIVKPAMFDLNGWTLRMLAAKSYGASQTAFLTNTVAIFGRNGVPKQKEGGASCSWMSFIVVGNPTTTLTGTAYDGPWDYEWTTDNRVFASGGELGAYYPVAMQLVRPSGIVEHEVAILGTNAYESVATSIAWQYSSTNMVRLLKANDAKSGFFALPDDLSATADAYTTVGVTGEDEERCKSALCWKNAMKPTPGDLNDGQSISANFPQPGGEFIMVFASVDTAFGHILQTAGKGTNTTETQTLTVLRGSESGVNIRYAVDPWCELGTVTETTGGKSRVVSSVVTNSARHYTVTVAKGATANVTVNASASVDSRLRKYGLDENNRYTPAVLSWLQAGTDAFGNPFYNTDDCEIKLAKFLPLSGGEGTDMTLTQMYWLDMDPTVGEMYFRAGMVRPPSEVVVEKPTYDPEADPEAYTNLRVGVYMSISNGNGKVKSGQTVWSPYVLRGLGAGELSWDYNPRGSATGSWTSETFKVTGYLNATDETGRPLTSVENRESWIPLRYFVFWKNSFDANHEAEIDVTDPFSTSSPAYSEGWYKWARDHGKKPSVFMRWDIDERLRPITAEILAPTNRLDGTGL